MKLKKLLSININLELYHKNIAMGNHRNREIIDCIRCASVKINNIVILSMTFPSPHTQYTGSPVAAKRIVHKYILSRSRKMKMVESVKGIRNCEASSLNLAEIALLLPIRSILYFRLVVGPFEKFNKKSSRAYPISFEIILCKLGYQ